jgi:perosamine synthetase
LTATKRKPPHVLTTLSTISYSAMKHFELQGTIWPRSFLLHARRVGKAAAGVIAGKREWMGGDNFVVSQANIGMSRLTRMIIRGQNFPMIVERRRRNFHQLLSRLGKIVQPVHESLPIGICPISFAFQHEKKRLMLKKLQMRTLDANIWETEHSAVPKGEFPEAERMRQTMLQLSCHQDLTSEAVDWLADQVCEVVQDLNQNEG